MSNDTESVLEISQKPARTHATSVRGEQKKGGSKLFKVLAVVILVASAGLWFKMKGGLGVWIDSLFEPDAATVSTSPSHSWIGKVHTVKVTSTEWTLARKPGDVSRGQCIRWWGEDPDGTAFEVEVRGINDSTWYEWENWLSLKNQGVIHYDFGWVRFRATSGVATVYYEFRLRDQCV